MSNVSLAERIEIDTRKLEAKKRKKDRLLFELELVQSEIRILESRLKYNKGLAEETPEKTDDKEEEIGLFGGEEEGI